MLSDIELVDKARRGDTHAFEELIRKYQDQIFRFALYRLPSRQDAEDMVQETFIKAYRNIGRVPWRLVARNLADGDSPHDGCTVVSTTEGRAEP